MPLTRRWWRRRRSWRGFGLAWDGVDAGDEAAKAAKEAMVALLNKRSYLRNLVRDVNEALGL